MMDEKTCHDRMFEFVGILWSIWLFKNNIIFNPSIKVAQRKYSTSFNLGKIGIGKDQGWSTRRKVKRRTTIYFKGKNHSSAATTGQIK